MISVLLHYNKYYLKVSLHLVANYSIILNDEFLIVLCYLVCSW